MPTPDAPKISSTTALGLDREHGHGVPRRAAVSVVLIDRRPLTRECLSHWLREGAPELRVVSLSSPADLLDSRRSPQPDLIVFSIGAASVREPDLLGKITLLRRHLGRIPLILLSDRDDVGDIVAAMEHGVRGYIPTTLEVSEAAAALQCVAAGGTFVPASALIKIAQDRQSEPSHRTANSDKRQFEALTPRESEVLARLRQGKPNKIIAHELEISEGTVKVFVRRILIKLHASNRTEVASLMRGRCADMRLSDRP